MSSPPAETTSDDPRHQAILSAAFGCFAQYGFRRTSMEDIAQAAGMSRPALYLHFRNKEDIFRSLVRHFYDLAIQQVGQALLQPGPPDEVLVRAFRAQSGEVGEVLLTSPHGAELLDSKLTNVCDIASEGEARLAALYAAWLRRGAAGGQVAAQDDPEATARLFIAAKAAVKTAASRRPSYPEYLEQLDRMARLLGRGLMG